MLTGLHSGAPRSCMSRLAGQRGTLSVQQALLAVQCFAAPSSTPPCPLRLPLPLRPWSPPAPFPPRPQGFGTILRTWVGNQLHFTTLVLRYVKLLDMRPGRPPQQGAGPPGRPPVVLLDQDRNPGEHVETVTKVITAALYISNLTVRG